MHALCIEHMLALKRILWYVQGTLQYGLHFYLTLLRNLFLILMLIGADVLTSYVPHLVIVCFLVTTSSIGLQSANILSRILV